MEGLALLNEFQSGKRSIGLDLKKPQGMAAARRLLQSCDIFLCNYSAPAIASLGLSYAALRELREDIIYLERCGITQAMDPALKDIMMRVGMLEQLDDWTEQLTRTYTKQALFEEGQARGVPITPVNTIADIIQDPHLAARGYWTTVAHPLLGDLRLPGAPFRLSATPLTSGPAPLLGQDNARVLAELGVSAVELATLRAGGTL